MSFPTNLTGLPDSHALNHNALNVQYYRTVYVDNYPSYQDAIDACFGGDPESGLNRTRTPGTILVATPGKTYPVSAPLRIYGAADFQWLNNDAVIQASVDMPSVVEFQGLYHSRISGLTVDVPAGRFCDYGVIVGQDYAKSRRGSSLNYFERTHINGSYGIGLEINGLNGAQDDCTLYLHTDISGRWTPGEAALSQIGVHLGGGANTIGHSFIGLYPSSNRTHIQCDGVQTSIQDMISTLAECDFVVGAATPLAVRNYRSEGAAQMLRMVSGSYGQSIHFEDWLFNADSLRADGRFIDAAGNGNLTLEQGKIENFSISPRLYTSSALNLFVRMRALAVGAGVVAAPVLNDFFDVNSLTSVGVEDFTRLTQGGVVDADGCLMDYKIVKGVKP